jgi:ParB family chromosome partitioning protein
MAKDFSSALGQSFLKDITNKTQAVVGTQNIVAIPLDQIKPDPDNDKIFKMENIDTLEKAFNEEGFIGAIEVTKEGDNDYEIVSGHRRFQAAKNSGRKTIPCIVLPKLSDKDRAKRLINSNLLQRKKTPLTFAKMLSYHKAKIADHKEGAAWRKEAAEYFKLSEAQVFRYQKILELIPELQDLCDTEGFPWTVLVSAGSLPKKIQEKIYEEIQDDYEQHSDPNNKVYNSARVRQIVEAEKIKYEKSKYISRDNESIKPIYQTTSEENLESKRSDTNVVPLGPSNIDMQTNEQNTHQIFNIDDTEDEESEEFRSQFYTAKTKTSDYNATSLDDEMEEYDPSTNTKQSPSKMNIPTEDYMKTSLQQLEFSLNGDMSNKNVISELLDRIEEVLNQIKKQL